MKPIELTQSTVRFNEENHTYTDENGRLLSGITSLIHSVLRVGVYPDADEKAKQVYIPRAAYYGTCVHKAIQTYDTIGVELTNFPEKEHMTEDFGLQVFPYHDVSDELHAYLKARGDKEVLASEFTVSYGSFASQIDSVWCDGDQVTLVDFKTNNVMSYPGGKQGLIDYLSWQLSCYSYMFEQQTGIKADIAGMHIRDGKAELWKIPMQPADKVMALLQTECILTDNGFTYFNPEMQVTDDKVVAVGQTSLKVPADITAVIAEFLRAERAAKEMKSKLEKLMRENGVIKWECDDFTASITKDSEATTFDSTTFKAEHPDLYEQYLKTTQRKGAFKIKSKY